MKRFIYTLIFTFICASSLSAQELDTTTIILDEVVISSFYQSSSTTSSVVTTQDIVKTNYGQEPSHVFSKMPSIISLNDNGTEYGYGYYRIRGLDQTRINVTLDGCPWNEAEDYGSYFANSPDLMSSMKTIRIDRGAGSSYNGIAGVAGGIMLESINIFDPNNESYTYLSGGSYYSHKATAVYNMTPQNGWGLHLKATHQYTNGFRDYGFNSSQAFTIKTGYKFNDKHTLDFLSMNGFHRNGQGWIGNTLEELELNPRANGNIEDETDNWFMSMNRLQYKMWATDNMLISSSVYFQFQDGSYRFDLDNYVKRMCGVNTQYNMLYDYGLKHKMLGGNIVGKYYLTNFTLTLGTNGYNFSRDHFLDNKSHNIPNDEYYSNRGIKNDISTFVMIQYNPFKNLMMSGNVQYRHASFNYIDYINNSNSFNKTDYDTEWDFCNFGFNIEYNPFNSTKIYTKFNHVNREPTRSDMFGGNETFTGEFATLNPEIANDIEFGFEYILSNKIYANVNFYHMWFKNELILNGEFGLNGLPCHDNAIESYRNGVEIDVKWQIVSSLNFDVNASYSSNKCTTESFGKTNHILTPAITTNADLYWNKNGFNIGFNTNYHSKMYVDISNDYSIPYLWTLNFQGLYKYQNLEFGLRVNNLTNRVNYCTGFVNDIGQLLYFRNAGTNFIASIKYVF
jgi:iron complex outermembrane receptor protein